MAWQTRHNFLWGKEPKEVHLPWENLFAIAVLIAKRQTLGHDPFIWKHFCAVGALRYWARGAEGREMWRAALLDGQWCSSHPTIRLFPGLVPPCVGCPGASAQGQQIGQHPSSHCSWQTRSFSSCHSSRELYLHFLKNGKLSTWHQSCLSSCWSFYEETHGAPFLRSKESKEVRSNQPGKCMKASGESTQQLCITSPQPTTPFAHCCVNRITIQS